MYGRSRRMAGLSTTLITPSATSSEHKLATAAARACAFPDSKSREFTTSQMAPLVPDRVISTMGRLAQLARNLCWDTRYRYRSRWFNLLLDIVLHLSLPCKASHHCMYRMNRSRQEEALQRWCRPLVDPPGFRRLVGYCTCLSDFDLGVTVGSYPGKICHPTVAGRTSRALRAHHRRL